MKKIVLVLLIVGWNVGDVHAQPVWGQHKIDEGRPWKLYAGAGLGSPRGRFSQMYDMGMNLAVSLGHPLSKVVQIRVKMELHRFGVDQSIAMTYYRRIARASGADMQMSGGNMNVMTFGADVKHDFPTDGSRLVPYVLAGTGVGLSSITNVTLAAGGREWSIDPEGDSDFYFEAGGGLEIVTTPNMSFFVQARYMGVHGDNRNSLTFLPLTFGVRF